MLRKMLAALMLCSTVPCTAAYVNDIGARLVKHLPPTGLKFRLYLVDLPEANAFNIPGGHVFISRRRGRHQPETESSVVENFPGEVALYDLDTGERKAGFVINGSPDNRYER
jgi:hypothetical protein